MEQEAPEQAQPDPVQEAEPEDLTTVALSGAEQDEGGSEQEGASEVEDPSPNGSLNGQGSPGHHSTSSNGAGSKGASMTLADMKARLAEQVQPAPTQEEEVRPEQDVEPTQGAEDAPEAELEQGVEQERHDGPEQEGVSEPAPEQVDGQLALLLADVPAPEVPPQRDPLDEWTCPCGGAHSEAFHRLHRSTLDRLKPLEDAPEDVEPRS